MSKPDIDPNSRFYEDGYGTDSYWDDGDDDKFVVCTICGENVGAVDEKGRCEDCEGLMKDEMHVGYVITDLWTKPEICLFPGNFEGFKSAARWVYEKGRAKINAELEVQRQFGETPPTVDDLPEAGNMIAYQLFNLLRERGINGRVETVNVREVTV